jgi:hypothetical protein
MKDTTEGFRGDEALQDAEELGLRFRLDLFAPARQQGRGIEVRLSPDRFLEIGAEARTLIGASVVECCRLLTLPPPEIRLLVDNSLSGDDFEVACGGAVRLAGALDTSPVRWSMQHRVAGAMGRTGAARWPPAGNGSAAAVMACRAVEQAVWDDPGLLLVGASEQLLERLRAASGTDLESVYRSPEEWEATLQALASRRVPFGDGPESGVALRGELLASPVINLEQASSTLRPYSAVILCGKELLEDLRPHQEGSGSAAAVDNMLAVLSDTWGVAYPRPLFDVDPNLGARAYRILVNGLVRGTGELPAARRVTLAEATDADVMIDPYGGWPVRWAEGEDAPVTDWSSRHNVLARHLGACLTEAMWEFADLEWTGDHLNQLSSQAADLVAVAKSTYRTEMIAAVVAGLAREGVPPRYLPEVLERLLWVDEDGTGPLHTIGFDPVDLTESARRGLRDYITHSLTQGTGHAPAVVMGPNAEGSLRRVGAVGPEDAYRFPKAGKFLRALQIAIEPWSEEPTLPSLLVPADLRPMVRRLSAAQLPRIAVICLDQLDDQAKVQQVAEFDLDQD